MRLHPVETRKEKYPQADGVPRGVLVWTYVWSGDRQHGPI